MMGRRIFVVVALAAVSVFVAPAAGAASRPLAQAVYKGNLTSLEVTPDGTGVRVYGLPVKQKCNGATPTNLGDYTSSPLGPFEVKKNGSFTNRAPKGTIKNGLTIDGQFKGNKVTGTIKAAAFKDTAKDFDCKKFSGKFSATRVKGTGYKPGNVIARDDFSDPNSGFDVFNTTNGFSEYLQDGRYRLGLRGSAAVAGLRLRPANLYNADVEVDALTFGGDPTDEVGPLCQAVDPVTFIAGFVQQNGIAKIVEYAGGNVLQRSDAVQLPATALKTGQGAKNTLRLVCRALSGEQTDVELFVNGESAVKTTINSQNKGQTGLAISGGGNGTDYNFTRYEVRYPKPE